MKKYIYSPGYLYPDGIGIWVEEKENEMNTMNPSEWEKKYNRKWGEADKPAWKIKMEEQARTIAALQARNMELENGLHRIENTDVLSMGYERYIEWVQEYARSLFAATKTE